MSEGGDQPGVVATLRAAPWHVLGAGRAGTAFARVLLQSGASVRVWTRSPTRAVAAAGELGVAVTHGALPSAEAGDAVRWLLCVPDHVLGRLSAALPAAESQRVIHCAGSLPATALDEVWRGRRAACHPLQSLSGLPSDVEALHGAFFAIDGEGDALALASALATQCGGHVGVIPSEAKAGYHAAAVVASQGVSALLAMLEGWSLAWGIEGDALRRGLATLAERSAVNAGTMGAARAATGPVVRGDASTLVRHLRALQDVAPSDRALYVEVQRRLLAIAEERGVEDEALAAIRSVLASDSL